MIRDLYRANFNLRQSSYFVPLLIAHGKHFYEILSCSIGRQEDWSHYLLWGSLPAVWIWVKIWCSFSVLRQLIIRVHLLACIGMNVLVQWLIINVTGKDWDPVHIRLSRVGNKWTHCCLRFDMSYFSTDYRGGLSCSPLISKCHF